MKREKSRRVIEAASTLGFALAALAFYSVRDLMAAFVLFSIVFLALGIAFLAVLSAEEALVWALHRTENYFEHYRSRRVALAAHPVTHRPSGDGN